MSGTRALSRENGENYFVAYENIVAVISRCVVLCSHVCFHVWCKQVEAEANPEVSDKLEIATVPTFVLLKVFWRLSP